MQMNSMQMMKLSSVLSAILFSAIATSGQTPRATLYTWRNVQIVGGGFVDGVIFHPSAKNLRYARTDMGGAYRWDAASDRWQPMLDWVPYKDLNLMGIESIAVDPSDANRVYLACGTYTNAHTPNGAILRSGDRGRTFQRTGVPFKFGGNEDGRGNGERLAVDPEDGRVLYLGTRHDGLWRSTDRGVTWTRVASFPDIQEAIPPMPAPVPGETPEEHYHRMPIRGDGIVFVKYAPNHGEVSAHQPTQTIYVGVSLMNRPNFFVSHDAGQSWQAIADEPTQYRPERAALSTDGFLYIAYGTAPGPSRMLNGAVWKLNTHDGSWTDITPDRPIPGSKEFGYAGISVDAQHPQTLIVSSFGRPRSAGGEDIFHSTDGGAHWIPLFGSGGQYDYTLAPYVKATPIHWLFDIEIDPLNADHATFTTGYGGWETFDLTAAARAQPTHWSILASGIEETVGLSLDSPAKGVPLISGIGDYGGSVHDDLDRPTPQGSTALPRFGNTTDVVSAALRPEVIVRAGINAEHKPDANLSYSQDGGKTWQGSVSTPAPGSRSGTLAVAADGATWIWTPEHMGAYTTQDRGETWTPARGLPTGLRVTADPVDPRVFYAISLQEQKIYRSTDSGATFSSQAFTLSDGLEGLRISPRADARGGQDQIYPEPGRSGELWFAAFNGLYHGILKGSMQEVFFQRMPGVDEVHAFGLGKAAPHHQGAALYLVGTVQGQPGIFRSIDNGKGWTRINDDAHQWGLVLQISGDPKLYGRVYVGTHGRGIFYGDPR
jgi:photosystem II stability/assembly factor-like uncharacterized protein